jgi:hypothetical protein
VAEVDALANRFCDLLDSRVLAASPHTCVLISLLLPRNDYADRQGLDKPEIVRRIANVQIVTRLYRHPRVGFINADAILDWGGDEGRYRELFQSDGYHLTPLGFERMTQNWIDHILPHVRGTGPIASKINMVDVITPSKEEGLTLSPVALLNGGSKAESKSADIVEEEKQSPPSPSVAEADSTVPDPFGSYTGKLPRV